MNKIIAAIDGLKYSESSTQHAIEFAKQNNAHLVGAFLEDFTYHSYKIYELVDDNGVSEKKMKHFEEKDETKREKAIEKFESACRAARLAHSIHRDRNIAIRELLHESVFADCLVIDKKETLTHYEEHVPTHFLRDLLPNVECPVVVVPHKYSPIEKVVFLYDGDPSSVFAIKMFSYLFPGFSSLPAEVITVSGPTDVYKMPENKLIREFMKRHWPEAVFRILKGEPRSAIVKCLEGQPNIMVVAGAYQRSMVSRWLRQSIGDVLMKELNVPLFIAHK